MIAYHGKILIGMFDVFAAERPLPSKKITAKLVILEDTSSYSTQIKEKVLNWKDYGI
jgi:hypothetical protein